MQQRDSLPIPPWNVSKQHIHILILSRKLLLQHKHTLAAADKLKQLNSTASYKPYIPCTTQRSKQKPGKFVKGQRKMDLNCHFQSLSGLTPIAKQ